MFDLFVGIAFDVLHDEVSEVFGFCFVEGLAKNDRIDDFDDFGFDAEMLFG